MYDDVLVPTDGSEHAVAAAAHGFGLAAAFDATIHVLAVVDVQSAAGPFDAGGVSDEFVTRLEADARDAIDDTLAAAERDSAVRSELVRGSPADAIVEYVDAAGIDLVAMGTHGRSGLRRYVAGSVTESVLRRSPAPVVTVRSAEAAGPPYESILVPTDGSAPADHALDHAVSIADRYDATVHALHVTDVRGVTGPPEGFPSTEYLEQMDRHGQDVVDAAADRAQDAGLEAVTATRRGIPPASILEYVDAAGIDLVAMGTHGRSGLDRFLLGSTAERTVRKADVPVLTVRPPAQE